MSLSDAILRSAMASKLAYAKNTQMITSFPISRQLLPDNNTFQVIDCSYTGAHAYIWKTGSNSTVIAFRGSHNALDICNYLDSNMIPFSFCDRHVKVHQSIYAMFSSIEPCITENLHPRQHVTFCGHSLGGGIAMFAAAYYAHMSNKNMNITCHTFGAPKVGNERFVQWFTDYVPNTVNLRNKYDIVTYFPFDTGYISPKTLMFNISNYNPIFSHDLDTYIENIVNNLTIKV